jgi:chloramphenicol 3-O-phosphotransferase
VTRDKGSGSILFLNGASSSGKSLIAKALQGMLEEPCIHFCIDDYLGAFQTSQGFMLPQQQLPVLVTW